jgi:hypothetical protein
MRITCKSMKWVVSPFQKCHILNPTTCHNKHTDKTYKQYRLEWKQITFGMSSYGMADNYRIHSID